MMLGKRSRKRYRIMSQEEHYSPPQIHFNRRQVLWLLQNLGTLQAGHWPQDASSYIDLAGIIAHSNKAPYIIAVECAAEIKTRLERCGIDGLILEALECWGKSEPSMASYLQKPEWVIRKRAKRALRYIASGPARRWHTTSKREGQTYQKFKMRKYK